MIKKFVLIISLSVAPLLVTNSAYPYDAKFTLFNDDGGWSWFQDERVVVWNGFLVIGSVASGHSDSSRKGNVEAIFYDIASGNRKRKVMHKAHEQDFFSLIYHKYFLKLNKFDISSNNNQRFHWADDHNAPSFTVLNDGTLMAAYAKHDIDNKVFVRFFELRGKNIHMLPEQIIKVPKSSKVTYSNLVQLQSENNRVYYFYRGLNKKPSYMYLDRGTEWKNGNIVINVPGDFPHRPYVKYATNHKDEIHFAFTEGHPRDLDNGIYHAYYKSGKLFNSKGHYINTLKKGLAKPTMATRVVAGKPDSVAWISDLQLDTLGNPYLVYSVQKDGARKPVGNCGQNHYYHYAILKNGEWISSRLAYAGTCLYPGEDDYTGLVALSPNNPKIVAISTNVDPITGVPLFSKKDGKRHWEIFIGHTYDYKNWIWNPLTRDSAHDNLRPIIPDYDRNKTFIIWLHGEYESYKQYCLSIIGTRLDF